MRSTLLLLAPALVTLAALSTSASAPLKCRGVTQTKPIISLDGAIAVSASAEAVMKQINQDDIESIDVRCVSAADSMTPATEGLGAVLIRTKIGPVSYVKPSLAAVLEAQAASFQASSAYIKNVSEIALPFRSRAMKLSLDVREQGWIAKATVDGTNLTCYVFDGAVKAPHSSIKAKQPSCLEPERRTP